MKVTIDHAAAYELQPGESLEQFLDGLSGRKAALFLYDPGRGEVRVRGPSRKGEFEMQCELTEPTFFQGKAREVGRDEALTILRKFQAADASFREHFKLRKGRVDWGMIVLGVPLLIAAVMGFASLDGTHVGGIVAAVALSFVGVFLLYRGWRFKSIASGLREGRLNVMDRFVEVQKEFPHLEMVLCTNDESVDVRLDIPEQACLSFAISAKLQDDGELHLSTKFYVGPCFSTADPGLVERFMEDLRGVLNGECYFLKSRSRWKATRLVCPRDDQTESERHRFGRDNAPLEMIRNERASDRTTN